MPTRTLQFTIDSINLAVNNEHPLQAEGALGSEDHYKLIFLMSHPRAGKANIATIKNLPLNTTHKEFNGCSEKIVFKEKVEVGSCVEISIQLLLIDNKSNFESFLSDIFATFLKPFFASITSGISNVIVGKLVEQPLNNIIDKLAEDYKTIKIADTVIDISEGVHNVGLTLSEVIPAMLETQLYYDDERDQDEVDITSRSPEYNWNNVTKTFEDAEGNEIQEANYLEGAELNYEIKYF